MKSAREIIDEAGGIEGLREKDIADEQKRSLRNLQGSLFLAQSPTPDEHELAERKPRKRAS